MEYLPERAMPFQQVPFFKGLLLYCLLRFHFSRLLGAMLLLAVSLPLYAQPTIQWDKTIGGNLIDELTSLQQTRDGGYILGGYSESGVSGDKTTPSRGDYSYWVVKLDSLGKWQWEKTFGGHERSTLRSLQQTRDGGYVLGGSSNAETALDKTAPNRGGCGAVCPFDYWVLKLDSLGNKVWDKTFGGDGDDFLRSLQQTRDGGYVLGGYSDSGVSGNKTALSKGGADYWVVKLDSTGEMQWDKAYGAAATEVLTTVRQTREGGYVLGGISDSDTGGDKTQANKGLCDQGDCPFDYWLVKLDAAGNKVWDKTLGGAGIEFLGDDRATSLQQTQDGGYILGGWSYADAGGDKTQASKGDADYWVIKLNAAGNKVWDKTLGGTGGDYLYALQQTWEGGYILGGWTYSGAGGDKTQASKGGGDYWVVQLDAGGNKIWDKTIGGGDDDVMLALQQTRDKGFVLGGYSYSEIGGDKTEPNREYPDYWVVKLAPFSAGGQVQSFTLINTLLEQAIAPLQDGDTINLATLATKKLNIRANTYPAPVGSVSFSLSGKQKKTSLDNNLPYALFGDVKGDYNKWTPPPGNYVLTARPYSRKDGKGIAGIPLTIRFTVINKVPPPRVESFTLINTSSEQPIRLVRDGDVLDLATLPAKLNIRADTRPPTVGSVKLELSGQEQRIQVENKVPYALFGDDNGDYEKWYPSPGAYTLKATAYTKKDGKGTAGTPLTIRFRVVNGDAPAKAAPVARYEQTQRQEAGGKAMLYPNPTADGRIRVLLGGGVQGPLNYSLLSAEGRKVAQGSVHLDSVTGLLDFDFSDQVKARGLYYLRIAGQGTNQVLKILKE